jgi:hypothetical protein
MIRQAVAPGLLGPAALGAGDPGSRGLSSRVSALRDGERFGGTRASTVKASS